MLIVLTLTIATNYILIPLYGITGSAIATAITISFYNILRWLFLYFKFRMQPYDLNTLKLIAIAFISFLPAYFIPATGILFVDLAIKSGVIGGG